jgi:protein-S-isoprenylcysteine O-methyltransferase Ste14
LKRLVARKAKAVTMKTKRIMPTTYLLIAIIAMIAIHFLFPVVMIIPSIWNLLGILPLVLGVVINLAADGAFHKANTTVKPYEESTALVTDGVFRISRNPMYLGFVLILIGIAVLLRSLSPYLVILAFVILIQVMFITVEEKMLAEKFDARWQEYRQNTRRWL